MSNKIIFILILSFSCQQIEMPKIVDPPENNRGVIKYKLGIASLRNPTVPQGKIIDMGNYHSTDRYYPQTQRRWFIYIPNQYDGSTPAKLLVINDGSQLLKKQGNPTIVMDNLIANKKMPITIAVFVDPGVSIKKNKKGRSIKNRSNEYDTCSPRYANFIEDEILSQVYKLYNISRDGKDHAIMGASSGASCAFTASWHRNDLFTRVISFIGSYCDFRSPQDFKETPTLYGHLKRADEYPSMVRKLPRKNIRIFLQSGSSDLDNKRGNWHLNNRRLVKALKFAKYKYKVAWGKDGHSSNHGVSLLPEIFQWIWQDN